MLLRHHLLICSGKIISDPGSLNICLLLHLLLLIDYLRLHSMLTCAAVAEYGATDRVQVLVSLEVNYLKWTHLLLKSHLLRWSL